MNPAITIGDCDTLFQACYTLIGADGDDTNVAFGGTVEVNNATGPFVDSTYNGTILIDGGTPPPPPTAATPCDNLTEPSLLVTSDTSSIGDTVCLSVLGFMLEDVESFQFDLVTDPTVVTFIEEININPALAMNSLITSDPAAGSRRYLFGLAGMNPAITIGDCDTLFQACYTLIGADGDDTNVAFGGTVEVNNATGPFVDSTYNGTILIDGGTPPPPTAATPCDNLTQPTVLIGSDTASIGDTVCLPIFAFQLVDIVSFGFELISDSTVARFVDTMNVHPLIANNGFFLNVLDAQTARFLWSPSGANPEITLNDCDTLMKVCYELVGMDMDETIVAFGPGISPEFNNAGGNFVDSLLNGSIRIEGGTTTCDPIVITEVITFPTCNGDSDGQIDITVTGGDGSPFSFSWSDGVTTEDRTGLSAGTFTVTVTSCTTATKSIIVGQPDELTAPGDITNVLCNGDATGEIDLSPMGGTPPYDYDWTGPGTIDGFQDQEDLEAGMFSVIVTDANDCTVTNSFTITEPTAITIDAAITNVLCNGDATGEIDLSPAGGTPPYTYDWTGPGTVDGLQDQEDLEAGTFSVLITDANDCTATSSFTISEPTAITITGVIANPTGTANNGAIDITVTGGTSPYTFMWAGPGVIPTAEDQTGLDADVYSVIVTDDNGCTENASFTLTREAPSISITSTESCNGSSTGTITTVVTGGTPPYDYNWMPALPNQPNHTNVAPGTYTLILTDAANQSVTGSIVVGTLPAAFLNVTVTPSSGTNDGAIDLTVTGGGGGPFDYQWADGPTTQDRINLPGGNFTVVVTDQSTGCEYTETYTVPTVVGDFIASIDVNAVNCNAANGGICDGELVITITQAAGDVTATFSNTGSVGLPATATLTGPGPHVFDGLCPGTFDVLLTDEAGEMISSPGLEITEPTELRIADFIILPVVGNGAANGGVDITPVGGTPPYSFQWNAGPNPLNEDNLNLVVGDYTVIITDANMCTFTSSPFTVEQFEIFNVNITDVTCSGDLTGAIDISIRGATGPFTYLWSNGATTQDLSGIQAGTYSVVVTDTGSGREVTGTYQVTALSNLFASAIVVSDFNGFQVTCVGAENAQIQGAATGGVGDITYLWNTGFDQALLTGIGAGTYTLTARDSLGCTSVSNEVRVSDAPAILADIRSDAVRCFGERNGRLTATINGGAPPYIFQWTNNTTGELVSDMRVAQALPGGAYDLEVIDANNCIQNFSAGVTEPALITVTPEVTNATTVVPGRIELIITGGTQPYDISYEGRNDTTRILDNIPFGTYTYFVTDANNCEVVTDEVTVANNDFDCFIASSVITPETMDNLNDLFLINCIEDFPNNSVQIFNRFGQLVREFEGYDNTSVVFDGRTRSGELLDEGGYFYVLLYRDTNNDEIQKRGSLNIIRQ